MLGLLDDGVALDFDLAASEHLFYLEAERERKTAEEIKRVRRK
jgi:hypothetical protein